MAAVRSAQELLSESCVPGLVAGVVAPLPTVQVVFMTCFLTELLDCLAAMPVMQVKHIPSGQPGAAHEVADAQAAQQQ
uniref:Uncharacterized protein n=1 Tax=Tetradesmus obliquus TaxID=3088 RepID=A0A383VR46_TETOB|eukprot:jgi/Sobl393_1/690/SZX67370.1